MSGTMIGALRRRIRIEAKALTPDGLGGASESWSEVATLWAELFSMRGAELFRHDAVHPRVPHRLRIRYRDDVTPAMRIALGSRRLAIDGVCDPDGRKRWLDIYCTEGAPS